uniref:KRAB domain-containing protein n=1 Tax=Pyxicephalus adspersus TaxID=30357 RepID=A0AAV2ZVM9_PYXAD|nr:TPA: hypothetical protein GDO54_005185 [Pyxicephalus adspersus]
MPPTDFEDVAVYFSKEEWRYLEKDQMDLYRQVMIDNYQTITFLGRLNYLSLYINIYYYLL